MAKIAPAKSRTPFYILIAIVVVVGAVGIWYMIRGNQQAPITLAPGTTLPPASGYIRGDSTLPVSIIEFADFECPGCGQFATLQEPDVRRRIADAGLASFRFYDYPLVEIHGNTMVAHLAASCASDQGKFWEMHDRIFEGQYDWNTQATREPRRVLDKYAEALGLDMKQYDECLSTRKNLARIEANKQAGVARGINQTPTLIIGEQVFPGGLAYDKIRKIVDSLNAVMGKAPAPVPSGDTAASTGLKR